MKTPPHDANAERAVIGTILVRPSVLAKIRGILSGPDDFYVGRNRSIYKSILNVGTDMGDISRDLTARSTLFEYSVFSTLIDEAVSSISAEHHAAVIADKARIRNMVAELEDCAREAGRPGINADEFLMAARKRVLNAADNRGVGYQTSLIHAGVSGALSSLKSFQGGNDPTRISSGITKIDAALRGGYMPGAVYLFGAPSGHGKTTYLQMMACQAARERGPVLFASPEMSCEELAEREIIRRSGISINRRGPWVHPGDAVPAEMAHCDAAASIEKEGLPIHVVENPDITMDGISDIARGIDGIRMVIVDYAQEVADRGANLARYLAVGEVGKSAIKLGKELSIPVVVASQVNVFKGDGGTTDYAFRETKDLEHRAHASMIMEIKRSQQVNQHGYHDVESARIFARKNRSGPMFDVPVDYRPATFLIADHVEKQWVPEDRYENGY